LQSSVKNNVIKNAVRKNILKLIESVGRSAHSNTLCYTLEQRLLP